MLAAAGRGLPGLGAAGAGRRGGAVGVERDGLDGGGTAIAFQAHGAIPFGASADRRSGRPRTRSHFVSVNGAVMPPALALVTSTQSKSCFSCGAPVLPVLMKLSASSTALAAKVATG